MSERPFKSDAPRPTPSQRERVYRTLQQGGRAGASESVISQDSALPLPLVKEALRLMRISGAVEQSAETKLWRTRLRGDTRACP